MARGPYVQVIRKNEAAATMSTRAVVFLALLLAALRLSGEEPPQDPIPSPPPERPARQEVVVVTPCRGCATTVINSPAAVSVIGAEAIEAIEPLRTALKDSDPKVGDASTHALNRIDKARRST